MFRFLSLRQILIVCLAFAGITLPGCRPSQVKTEMPPIMANMKALSVFYGGFTGEHQGRPPRNEQEFKDYLKKQSPERLSQMNVDNVDSLFVSPRDNQALVFHFDVRPAFPGSPDAGPFAHEQTGVDGKRFVLLTSGTIEEMDQEKFDQVATKK